MCWNQRRFRIKRGVFAAAGLALAALMLVSPILAEAQGGVNVLDECWGVDHFPVLADYPNLDPDGEEAQNLLNYPSWIILGFTFDLGEVPVGSMVTINFADGVTSYGTIGEYGRAMVYRGISSYGNYPWTDEVTDPDGEAIGSGLAGTVQVDANENLDCTPENLAESEMPMPESQATVTPFDFPTPTPEPVLEFDQPETPFGDGGIFDGSFGFDWNMGIMQIAVLCLCCLLVLAAGGTVVIVIRRRQRLQLQHKISYNGDEEDEAE